MDNKTLSMLQTVSLKSVIGRLMESDADSIAISDFCKTYAAKIDSGVSEFELYESFVVELSKIANTSTSKTELNNLNNYIKENASTIKIARSVSRLPESSAKFVAPVIESAVVDYVSNKNAETRKDLRIALSLFESDMNVKDILEEVNFEEYQERDGKVLVSVPLQEAYVVKPAKMYTEDEVQAIIENRLSESANAVPVKKTMEDVECHINLHGTVTKIINENYKNEKLRIFCEKFINAMNAGKSEAVLYESFISGISNWNYLNAVDTEVSALKDRVSKYKQEIDLKRITETMKQTASYYIVPLIEDLVAEYAINKTPNNRVHLIQRLRSFEYDPFVRDIINIVNKDESIPNTVFLGESIENANKYVHTEQIFSPVKYIKEGEVIFNVRGTYYMKSGDVVSKLGKSDVAKLDESFKNLCNLVNSSSVQISSELNSIKIYSDKSVAVINESEVLVDGKKISTDDIDNICAQYKALRESDMFAFYSAIKVLNENFDSIAPVDFVKRVAANDNPGHCVDVFKIGNNIFVNTINESLGRSVFYKNVNPIQCKNYINEHMGIKVDNLFEDVLPDQDSVKGMVEAKKKEYESYIDSLEEKKNILLSMKDESDETADIDAAIEMIDKKIADTKDEYKKYQDDVEKFMNGDDTDAEDSLKKEVPTDDGDDNDDDNDNNGGKNDDEGNETESDMKVPLSTDSDIADEPDEYADVPDFDSDFDTVAVGSDKGDESFKVMRVTYNKNVKSGYMSNKGEVIVVIPSVDANGDVHNDMRKVTFYLDSERNPVINNDYMPLDMYTAIQNAIIECPETETVVISGEEDTVPSTNEPVAVSIDAVSIDTPAETSVDTPEGDNQADASKDVAVEPAKVETPDDVKKSEDEVSEYPIEIPISPDEISPKDMSDFEKDLDGMKIEHSASESEVGSICMKIGNKAQAHALKKYFKDWMNYGESEFVSFFPELKNCFNNKPSGIPVGPTNEGVQIKGINPITKSNQKVLDIVIPMKKEYCDLLGIKMDESCVSFRVLSNDVREARRIYERLYSFAKTNDVDEDVKGILEHYSPLYESYAKKVSQYTMTVPYNGFLESKLEAKGYKVNRVDEGMSVDIVKNDYIKTKNLLEKFYGDAVPVGARDFFKFVNENVHITIKDETTGKTVEIDTDDVNGKSSEGKDAADFDSSFKGTTFDYKDNLLFNDDEDSADENKDEGEDSKSVKGEKSEGDKNLSDDEKKEKDEKEGEETEKSEKDEESENEDKKSEKKKFTFKTTKKSKKDESVKYSGDSLNESAAVNVLDYVETPSGKGQIISKFPDGTFIVNVMGHTLPFKPSQLKACIERPDTLDFNMKFDEETLKGLVESYVSCGMFIDGMKVTPADCKVKLLEYNAAKDDDELEIIIEGTKTSALKKYIQITENLNEWLDLDNYAEGKLLVNVEGVINESDVLVNKSDYSRYKLVKESVCPCRVLVFDDNKETHLRYINGTNLRLNENDDEYVPDYVRDLNAAVELATKL